MEKKIVRLEVDKIQDCSFTYASHIFGSA